MTSKRMEFGGKDGPGPGEYEPYRYNLEKSVNVLHCPSTDDESIIVMLVQNYFSTSHKRCV